MQFLPENFRLFLTLALISFFLILLDSLNFLKIPKSYAQTITIPIQYGLYQGGKTVNKQLEFIVLARFAAQENKALKRQLGQLLIENANLQKRLKESEELVDQYNKLNPKTYDLLPARVLGGERYLKIDKGSSDGVALGQVVVFQDHYLGQIKNVSPKTSEVLLLHDPDSKIAVFSQGEGRKARGILLGQFGSEILMDKILHQEKIEVGDLVYSEGTEGKLPKGLILGKVTQVLERQNEVFKQAKVEPIFQIYDLDIVFVILNP